MKNIAIIAGGYSGEVVISVKSAETVEQNIDKTLFSTYKIVLTKEKWCHTTSNGLEIPVDKNDFSLTINDKKILFDAAFIIIHGTPGEDGKLQGYLDMMNIPYCTCDAYTSALTFSKYFCNRVVQSFGTVNVAKSMPLNITKPFSIDEIGKTIKMPCIVKPNAGGSSIGVSKVLKTEDLQKAIDTAFKEDTDVLIEEFITGRELTCGVVSINGKITALPVTEVISKNTFFDFEAKYTSGKSDEVTPANIPDELRNTIQFISMDLYKKLNCFCVVRIDYIVEENTGNIYFLEVNTVPGQSAASIVPQQVHAHGWTLQGFYTDLINEALRRK